MVVKLELSTPDADELAEVVDALRQWQRADAPIQLHPGDLGWFWRSGADAVAAAVRTWRHDGRIVALGFLDGATVLRMTVARDVWGSDDVARQVIADLAAPRRGVLPAGKASVEAPDGTRVQELLDEHGWRAGDPWTPLRRDLAEPVARPALRVEVVGAGQVPDFTAVHRSAWGSPRFTDERWHTMAAGLPFADGRCLLAYDGADLPVAGITVWSAGPGRPGLIEPLGTHADHRGHGHATAICVAAAAELQAMGSSSAMVCTEGDRTSAIATYRAAGYEQLPDRLDRTRDA